MACSPKPSVLSLLLLIVLLPIAQLTLAGRPVPTTDQNKKQTQGTPSNKSKHMAEAHSDKNQTETSPSSSSSSGKNQAKTSPDKKQPECFGPNEGTVLIPGVGRYMIGSHPQLLPTVGHTFLGDSVPAAMNGQYLPGNDDTFVPNPGYEVPNPFRGGESP